MVRTDRIKIFLCEVFSIQRCPLQHESVTLFAGVLPDIIRHEVQGFLFAGTIDPLPIFHILKSNAGGNMDMAVNDAGHDEFPAEVGNLSFVFRKSCLIAHIDKFSILHHKRARLRLVFICGKDFCVFDDLICFHSFFLS